MSTSLIEAMGNQTNRLDAEHSVAVITARVELRNTYLRCRETVTGTTVLDGVALSQMDDLDRFVGQWILFRERTAEQERAAKEAIKQSLEGERI